MELKHVFAGVVAGALLVGTASAAQLTIDDFDFDASVSSVAGGAPSGTVQGVPGVFGGTRAITVEALIVGAVNPTSAASLIIDGGKAFYSADPGVGFVSTLEYSGAPQSVLLDGVNERFEIDLVFGDGEGDFTFTMTDESANEVSLTKTIDASLLGVTGFSFADMVGDPAFDFDAVTMIAFTVAADTSLDLTLEFLGITTDPLPEIPVPAGAPLLASALAGFFAFRRVRRA